MSQHIERHALAEQVAGAGVAQIVEAGGLGQTCPLQMALEALVQVRVAVGRARLTGEDKALRVPILAVTRDPRFVTARHSLQTLWKVGAVSPEHQRLVAERLAQRFREAAAEKNGTLVRYDIVEGLRKLYNVTQDEQVREVALALIASEGDSTYQRKYASLWRTRRGAHGGDT